MLKVSNSLIKPKYFNINHRSTSWNDSVFESKCCFFLTISSSHMTISFHVFFLLCTPIEYYCSNLWKIKQNFIRLYLSSIITIQTNNINFQFYSSVNSLTVLSSFQSQNKLLLNAWKSNYHFETVQIIIWSAELICLKKVKKLWFQRRRFYNLKTPFFD